MSNRTVPVSLTLFTEPAVAANRSDISLSIPVGSGIQSENMEVWNSGTGTLNYTVSDNRSWISVSPTSGNSTGSNDRDTLTVTLNPSGLAGGQTHTGTITINGQTGVTPLAIPVSLTLNEEPVIAFSPTQLDLSYPIGAGLRQETFTITNAGTGTLDYTLTDNRSWITLSRSSGSLASGAQHQVTMTTHVNSLAEGSYTAIITATGQSGVASLQLPITIEVFAEPIIRTSPAQFNITQPLGNGPVTQTMFIYNDGTGTLHYNISANVSWISFTTTTGSAGVTPGSTAVSFLTQNLAEGTHQAVITVTGQSGVTPLPVPVTITITTQPTIAVDTTEFSIAAGLGSGPSQDSFKLWNGGTGTLQYSISSNVSWLQVSPISGSSTGPLDQDTITNTFQTQTLSEGSHQGTITVSSVQSGVSPVTIPVTVQISAEPAIGFSPASYSLNTVLGSPQITAVLSISNTGTGTLNYALSANQPWVSFVPTSGQSGGETDQISVRIDTAALSVGTNSALITISGQSGVSSETVPLTVTVTADSLTLVGHHWHDPDFCVPGSTAPHSDRSFRPLPKQQLRLPLSRQHHFIFPIRRFR